MLLNALRASSVRYCRVAVQGVRYPQSRLSKMRKTSMRERGSATGPPHQFGFSRVPKHSHESHRGPGSIHSANVDQRDGGAQAHLRAASMQSMLLWQMVDSPWRFPRRDLGRRSSRAARCVATVRFLRARPIGVRMLPARTTHPLAVTKGASQPSQRCSDELFLILRKSVM
jgi:hypothetical protein